MLKKEEYSIAVKQPGPSEILVIKLALASSPPFKFFFS